MSNVGLPVIDDALVKIIVANGREPVADLGEVFDGLFDPIGGHVIGSRFGTQARVIADVLFEATVCVMSTDHGVGQIEVRPLPDDGLKLSLAL
jgi:hypothetical protein